MFFFHFKEQTQFIFPKISEVQQETTELVPSPIRSWVPLFHNKPCWKAFGNLWTAVQAVREANQHPDWLWPSCSLLVFNLYISSCLDFGYQVGSFFGLVDPFSWRFLKSSKILQNFFPTNTVPGCQYSTTNRVWKTLGNQWTGVQAIR